MYAKSTLKTGRQQFKHFEILKTKNLAIFLYIFYTIMHIYFFNIAYLSFGSVNAVLNTINIRCALC